jgi:hypothetical protein
MDCFVTAFFAMTTRMVTAARSTPPWTEQSDSANLPTNEAK